MKAPIKLNETYEIEIIDYNHKGQGFARVEGFAVFIDGGLKGDIINGRIKILKKNYAVAEIESFVKKSENRVEARCEVFGECGGCQIQNLSYEAQLEIKTNRVKDEFRRAGFDIERIKINDCLGMEDPFRYRNKAQFPVQKKNGDLNIGFYRRGTHEVINTDTCVIQHESNDKLIDIVKEYMDKCNVMAYDEIQKTGIIRHVLTKTSFKTNDMMVVIITNGKKLPSKEILVDMITSQMPEVKSIVQNINNKRNNVILGDKTVTLWGETKIVDYIEDLEFKISCESFFQVNPVQTEVLYRKALEYADITKEDTVFDLYCGIGTISLFLARDAKKVYGVEIVKEAIEDAKENAKLNNIDNAEFYVGEAEEVFPKLHKQGITADVVVVDPPRRGCETDVLDTIAKMQPKKFVYVSCNPSSLARDIKYLEEKGYELVEVQPVDMFPHTMHVESVVKMVKKEEK